MAVFLLHVLAKMPGVPAWSLSVSLNEFNDGRVLGFFSLSKFPADRVLMPDC